MRRSAPSSPKSASSRATRCSKRPTAPGRSSWRQPPSRTSCSSTGSCPTSAAPRSSARSAKMDEVVGLEVGADDYIKKPFDSRILAARINAHLRRAALAESVGGREGLLTVGALQIDNAARRLKLGDDEIPLTMTEFNLLAVLAANPERVLTRAQLRDKVWGDPHVQRLRRKLAEHSNSGVNLEAVPGLGYRLSVMRVSD